MDVNTVIKHITYNLMYCIKIFKPFTIEKSPFYKTSFQLPFEKIGWNPSSIHSSSFTFQLVSLSSRSTWYAMIKMAKLARCSSITFLTFYIWKLRCVSTFQWIISSQNQTRRLHHEMKQWLFQIKLWCNVKCIWQSNFSSDKAFSSEHLEHTG